MLDEESRKQARIVLPTVPEQLAGDPVAAWAEPVRILTYEPAEPDPYPAFLDSRVYQGSSGRVYPLPFHERIEAEPRMRAWRAVHLENERLRLMILPELGGRIHIAYDKVADYDIFYRNNVIKPALVGLAGPWISGGVEFNWPQHHRPATYLPADVEIEHEDDGSITVWCSDHDPFARMKGMHGIRLRPGSTLIEARVRLYNRSELPQTFLWWANVAAAVNDDYQSFFPTDVAVVADHARRATTTFPHAGTYYGVDYAGRAEPDADRLDWYRNIPVPTSYMVLGTDDEFFGGYDHGRDAGFVHWADRDVSPGKKQWTWGDAPFGWAWDRNLTEDDGPYIELMAGVFTDNQPDFAWLAPGETKTFSQYWYPIHRTGPVQQASLRAAVSARDDRVIVSVTSAVEAVVTIATGGAVLVEQAVTLRPESPHEIVHAGGPDITVTVRSDDEELVRLEPRSPRTETRSAAVEPPMPEDVDSVDQLVRIGHYLQQYRHATRAPGPYWLEAVTRDPRNVEAHTALGAAAYADGLFDAAIEHLRVAVDAATEWTPTPRSGESHYRLGLALLRAGRDDDAREALARAAWDAAWRTPASWALARLAARESRWRSALDRLDPVVAADADHSQARCLRALVRRRLGMSWSVDDVLGRDPLDHWARDLAGLPLTDDATILLDIALEYAGVGFDADALRLLDLAERAGASRPLGQVDVAPLVAYHRARITGEPASVDGTRHCLPHRLDDIAALRAAGDATASALLGHWYYDRGRHDDAIQAWEVAERGELDPFTRAVVLRNLGVAAYNVRRDAVLAAARYDEAIALAPDDAKLRYERDQLAERAEEPSAARLARLLGRLDLVAERDDLTVTFAELLIDEDRADEALAVLADRAFQPWEGGEGRVLAAWERASLAIAAAALVRDDPQAAVEVLRAALEPPAGLGEARHPLANAARLHLALGDALAASGDRGGADRQWRIAADSAGDFTGMRTREHSEQTAFSVLALRRLGRDAAALALTDDLARYTEHLAQEPAVIDYFATSLPTMLLFVDPPQRERDREVARLRERLRGLTLSGREPAAHPTAATGWQ